MKNSLALAAAALAVATTICAVSSAAEAKDCPANARNASLVLWAGGTIPTGKTVTGMHPCGRQLSCVGGEFCQPRVPLAVSSPCSSN